MNGIVIGLMGVGWLVSIIGSIMLLIVAFKESVLWGLGCLFIPFVALVFIIMHWSISKRAFFIQLAGIALIFLAVILGGGSAHVSQP